MICEVYNVYCHSLWNLLQYQVYMAEKKVTVWIKLAQNFFFKVFSKNSWLEVWFMKLIEAASLQQ